MIPILLFLLTTTGADAIVAKHIAARGGEAKFAAIKGMRVEGRIKFGNGPFTPFTMLAARPTMFRMELSLNGAPMVQGYDGRTPWETGGTLSEQMKTQIKDQAIGAIGGPLVDYRQRGIKVDLASDKAKWKTHPAIQLKVTLPTGTVMQIYLSPTTYLEIGEELFVKLNGQDVVLEEDVGGNQRYGGVLFPTIFTSNIRGQTSGQRLELQKIEINPKIDESLFRPK